MLREAKAHAVSELVVTSPMGRILSYEYYFRTLRRYCRELDIRHIGTHGLRHSTSTLYLAHGATRSDLRELFAHSSEAVTQRYIHVKDSNLATVAQVILLFPECSQIVPKKEKSEPECNSDSL